MQVLQKTISLSCQPSNLFFFQVSVSWSDYKSKISGFQREISNLNHAILQIGGIVQISHSKWSVPNRAGFETTSTVH